MGARGFERRLENLVEGVFGRVFRSTVRPVEIGRRLVRELDATRDIDVRGATIVANAFTVFLSEADYEQFADIHATVCAELADAAREHARDEGYQFVGNVSCEIVIDPELRTGAFAIDARFRETADGTGPGTIVLPSGERRALGEDVITIGRMPGSTIVLNDPNASRHHAEIRPSGSGYVLVDLGSMNGSRVNGARVDTHRLSDGDALSFGNTVIRFETS
ncbi:MAG: DUF3662 domain-containing protein [Actinobacteria bacterium]|nr:DUF3662 domain-containing protein [Actinomycetota bacterium]